MLKYCLSVQQIEGQKASKTEKVPILRWLSRKTDKKGGQNCLLFFECISQPMKHVGKRCQIKKRPSPFWQCSQQSPVHRGLSSDAPRLQKQQNITSLLSQIKELLWKGGEGAGIYKKQQNSSTAPTKTIPLRTGRAGRPVWLIYQLVLNSQ